MEYLAILQTDDYEWVCLSDNEAEAKQGVFDGYNTFLKKMFERDNDFAIETTHEYLQNRLNHYYKTRFKGDVSIETLESGLANIIVLELEKNECYRDGFRVPRREQDI